MSPADLAALVAEGVARELGARQEAARAARQEKADEKRAREPAPRRNRWKAVKSGAHKRRLRPRSSPDDARSVPAALRHWRQVHGLTTRQAQARIGYSPNSSTWRHWEAGYVMPPYSALLQILAATGLGHWRDDEGRAQMTPEEREERDAAKLAEIERRRGSRSRRTAR